MNITITILIILSLVICIIACVINFKDDYCIFCFAIGIFLSTLIIGIVYLSYIPAIDVYRGKTTLEITYKDNIPIDSVVVYKK